MVHKTFIASSITVCKPPNASLAMTHKTYCTISHASCNKRRKIQHLCLNCHRGFDLRGKLFFVTVVSYIHVTVMCWSLNSQGWIKTQTVKHFNGHDVNSFCNNCTVVLNLLWHEAHFWLLNNFRGAKNKHDVTRKERKVTWAACVMLLLAVIRKYQNILSLHLREHWLHNSGKTRLSILMMCRDWHVDTET